MTVPNRPLLLFFLTALLPFLSPGTTTPATTAHATKSVAVPTDHSTAAVTLFNNLRTPAALVGATAIHLGLLSPPPITDDDSTRTQLCKKANVLIASAAFLSEIISVTYSTVAVNNLAGIRLEPTANVGELITKHLELSWVGANVHFLLGMLGLALLVGSRAYVYGRTFGRVVTLWSLAAFLHCVGIVDRGIALGLDSAVMDAAGSGAGKRRFSHSLAFLTVKYVRMVVDRAREGSILPAASILLFVGSLAVLCADLFGEGGVLERGAAVAATGSLQSQTVEMPAPAPRGFLGIGRRGQEQEEEEEVVLEEEEEEEEIVIPNWR